MGRRVCAVQAFLRSKNLGSAELISAEHLSRDAGSPCGGAAWGADDPASPQFVVTRRGLGYLFNA